MFNVPDVHECILDDAHSITQLVMGDNNAGDTLRVANGGSLTTGAVWSAVGYNSPATMVVDSGGTVTFGQHMWVGLLDGSDGVVVLNGGVINVTEMIGLGWNTGKGTIYLKSGELNLANIHPTDSIKDSSLIDISGGTITITGDHLSKINDYIAAGKIIATGATGNVLAYFDADAGKTIVKDGMPLINVTFQVDLSQITDLYEGGSVWVAFGAWDSWHDMTDEDGDNIYKVTVPIEQGTELKYFFSYQNGADPWSNYNEETVPAECADEEGYRLLLAPETDVVLPAVAYGSCEEASGLVDITDLEGGYIKSSNEDSLWTGPDSDGSPNGERIKFLIDNDVNTKFLVGADTSWIDYYTTTLSMVTSYTLTSANDVPTRDPMHWVFQGWDAETLSWVTLDSVVDNPVWEERFQKRTFEFENTEYYSNYRLHILSTNNDPQCLMQIAEWEIFGELGADVDGDVTNYAYVTRGSNEDSLWTGPGGGGGSPDAEKLPNLTDNDIHTKYLVDAVDSWLDVHTTKMSKVTSYTITSANDVPTRDPNSWVLQGWDRMTATWVTLDSVVGQPEWEERFQTKPFEVDNADQWFSSYRLHITALNSESEILMQIAELQLLGEIGDDVPADVTDLKVEIAGEFDDLEWPDGGSPGAEQIPKLIDNNLNTKYLTKATMSWLELYTKKLSIVNGYAITSANDVPERDPATWLLQGWDGGAWVTLDSVANQPMWEERFQTKTWDISNDSLAFSTYRLHILAINGDAEGLMQIAELQLFGELAGNTAVQYGVTDVEEKEQVVSDFRLDQNYPNPFNPSTTIRFVLPTQDDVKLTIYDIRGREVVTLVDAKMTAGYHNVTFNAARFASGVYFYRLKTSNHDMQKKMTFIK